MTTRVSIASDGTEGDLGGDSPSISTDGRFIAFASLATNLVMGDTNGTWDVFVHDRQEGLTTRVSVSSDGTQGNNASWRPSMSADGRYVAFESSASNLVPGDTNRASDVFVHDRHTSMTTRVSVASDGTQGVGESFDPSISADGRYVAFQSWSADLVEGDTVYDRDIYVHDRQTGKTIGAKRAADGTHASGEGESPSISADGRYVAFSSNANNLVDGDSSRNWDVFVVRLR